MTWVNKQRPSRDWTSQFRTSYTMAMKQEHWKGDTKYITADNIKFLRRFGSILIVD